MEDNDIYSSVMSVMGDCKTSLYPLNVSENALQFYDTI